MATETATRPTPKRRTKTAKVTEAKAATTKTPTTKGKASKATASKATATKTSTKAPAKAATKRSAKAKVEPTKVAPKTKAVEKTATAPVRELNLHGFVPGSDSALIVDAMIAGGASRKEVNQTAADSIEKVNGLETRNGGVKNVPSLTSALLARLEAKGYTVRESWVVEAPADVQAQMKKEEAAAKRRATRASKK